MSFKNKFKNSMMSNVIHDISSNIKLAKVIESDEGKNICSIEVEHKNRGLVVIEEVPLMIGDPGLVSWFPKEEELVIIEEHKSGMCYITGPSFSTYSSGIKSKRRKYDIHPDNLSDETNGGYIY